MTPLRVLALLLSVSGCSSCGNGSNKDGDAELDTSGDNYPDTSVDSDRVDIPDANDDSIEDTVYCDPIADYTAYDLSFLDPPSLPSRSATECGECCRQVSITEHEVVNCGFSVYGRYLAVTTSNRSSTGIIREYLIDLSNLDHYLIVQTGPYLEEELFEYAEEIALHDNLLAYVTIKEASTGPPPIIVDSSMVTIDLENATYRTDDLGEYVLGRAIPSQLNFSGDWFAWIETRDVEPYPLGLNVMDLATGTERMVDTGDGYDASEPDIEGDRVVFRQWDHRIRIYDISEGTFTDVSGGETFDWYRYQPGIWGNLVAWHDLREGGDYVTQELVDIYMKDIVTGEETVVCNHPAAQVAALDMGYGLIAWPDLRNDPVSPNNPYAAENFDIYAYRIETGEEFQVTDLPGRELCPKIFENRIYFVMEDDAGVLSVFEKIIPPWD
jgi:hypothetical protein